MANENQKILQVVAGIGISILLIWFMMFSYEKFVPAPEGYDDFYMYNDETSCTDAGGVWTQRDEFGGYCDVTKEMRDTFQQQMDSYQNTRFLIFYAIGVILFVSSFYVASVAFQSLALVTGAGLAIISAFSVRENENLLLIASGIGIVLLIFMLYRRFGR